MLSAQPFFSVTQVLSCMVRMAAERHQEGRLAEARTLYLEVLTMDPHHADALFLLGALERRMGRLAEARQHLREALRWTAKRGPVDAELAAVERLMKGPGRAVLPPWAAARVLSASSALPLMAQA
jgi:tetratricopeptide (TPR) repeat protein